MAGKQDIYTIQENGIDLFSFCRQEYLPNKNTEFKTYDGYLKILRVLSGTAVWKIENKEYRVKKDDILILNNGERRQLVMQNESQPLIIEYAQFLPFFLHPHQNCALPFFFREQGFKQLHAEKEVNHAELLTLFDNLSLATRKDYLFKKEYVYALLLQTLSLFGEKLRKENDLQFSLDKNLHLYQTVSAITEYVAKNPDKDLAEETLAKQFGISKHYLSRSFKAYNGVNFPTFVKTIRIQFAISLLKDGKSVIDTAYLSGFGSLSAFYEAFKQIIGLSPTKFLSQT